MRSLMTIASLASIFAAAGCGGDGDDKPPVESNGTPPTSTSSATEAAVSDDCKLAVLNWVDVANRQRADLAFGAPDNASDPAITEHANEIQTYCSTELSAKVADIGYRLALGEAQLVAGNEPTEDVAALTADIDAVSDSVK